MSDRPAPGPEFELGEGRISGTLSVALGALGFGAVLCLLFPDLLTTPKMRAVYPMGLVRGLIQLALVAALVAGVISVVLSRNKTLGLTGAGLAVAATLLGGSEAEVASSFATSNYVGLDWFVLNLFLTALVCVPLERAFARRPQQRIFRAGWETDLAHFFASHVMVQVTVLLTMIPAAVFFGWAAKPSLGSWIAAQPIALQFVEALVLADLFAYFSHRMFHAVPFLWRFHAIHHSSEALDWLAASRLHLVDIVVTRAIAFVPLYALGFSERALYPYLVFASIQGIFIHTNTRLSYGPLRHVLVTPQFHHWHHTAQKEALDRNFAIHLPLVDWAFGTHYLPADEWPSRYGIEERSVPDGWWQQLVYPFRSD